MDDAPCPSIRAYQVHMSQNKVDILLTTSVRYPSFTKPQSRGETHKTRHSNAMAGLCIWHDPMAQDQILKPQGGMPISLLIVHRYVENTGIAAVWCR